MWRFCWHNWSKWQTYSWEGTSLLSKQNISRTVQARQCLKCGKELHRVVENAAGATYAQAVGQKTVEVNT